MYVQNYVQKRGNFFLKVFIFTKDMQNLDCFRVLQ